MCRNISISSFISPNKTRVRFFINVLILERNPPMFRPNSQMTKKNIPNENHFRPSMESFCRPTRFFHPLRTGLYVCNAREFKEKLLTSAFRANLSLSISILVSSFLLLPHACFSITILPRDQ